jgi:hypothetical protein
MQAGLGPVLDGERVEVEPLPISLPISRGSPVIREPRCCSCELTRYRHPSREQARRLFYLAARRRRRSGQRLEASNSWGDLPSAYVLSGVCVVLGDRTFFRRSLQVVDVVTDNLLSLRVIDHHRFGTRRIFLTHGVHRDVA